MKYSNSCWAKHSAGNIPTYARYFQKFVEEYAAAGVKVRAVTTQNEIDADQGGECPRVLGRRRRGGPGDRLGLN